MAEAEPQGGRIVQSTCHVSMFADFYLHEWCGHCVPAFRVCAASHPIRLLPPHARLARQRGPSLRRSACPTASNATGNERSTATFGGP